MNSVTYWKISNDEVCCKSVRRMANNNKEGLRIRRVNVNWTKTRQSILESKMLQLQNRLNTTKKLKENLPSQGPPITEKIVCLKVLRLCELFSLTATALRSRWVWNTGGKILTVENRKTQGNISHNASLYTVNLIQTSLGSNQGSSILLSYDRPILSSKARSPQNAI
jgi:hypothetical protein